MKSTHALLAAPALLVLGAFAGHGLFPSEVEAPSKAATSIAPRSKAKLPRMASESAGGMVSPTDLAGLLALVDPQGVFQTETKLRAALGGLSASALENLIIEMNEGDAAASGFHTLRLSLINHFVDKEPFLAMEFIIAQEDPQFKNSYLNLAVRAAALIDMEGTRNYLEGIEDSPFKKSALMAVANADTDASAESLLAILEGGLDSPTYQNYPGFSPWFSQWGHYGNWGGGLNFTSISGAVGKLALKDLAAAESYAAGLKTPGERRSALSQIANSLAQEDPDRAMEWVRGLESRSSRDQNMMSVLSRMAVENPQKAIGFLDEISNLQQRNSAISSILGSWIQKDVSAGIAWLETLPAGQARASGYMSAAEQLSQIDPKAAMGLVEKMSADTARHVISQTLNQWAVKDFDGAREWVKQQDDPVKLEQGLSQFISTWSAKDPGSAAQFLEAKVSEVSLSNSDSYFRTIASQWASVDQNAALTWAAGLENEKQSSSAVQGVYNRWATQDPESAAQHLATLPESSDRTHLLQRIAGQWTTSDPDASQAWLASLPISDRFRAASSAFSSLGSSQPQAAAELYDRMIVEAGNNEEHLRSIRGQAGSIADSWSRHEPVEAAQWASGIANENDQSYAYQQVTSNWVQYDPSGAAEWINDLPQGKPRDSATKTLVDKVREIDPASAFEWADTISNDDARYSSLRDVVYNWKNSDVEAARDAVVEANLNQEQRDKLLKRLE